MYYKAGLLSEKNHGRYTLRAHSIRKYFRTQLSALGVNTDVIDYFMGHILSTYMDIQMKGIARANIPETCMQQAACRSDLKHSRQEWKFLKKWYAPRD